MEEDREPIGEDCGPIEVEGAVTAGEVQGPAASDDHTQDANQSDTDSEQLQKAVQKHRRIRRILWVVLMAAAVAIYLLTRMGGSIGVKLDDAALNVTYPQGSYTVQVQDMTGVQLVASPALGTLVSGKQDRSVAYGWAENSAWGQYRLFVSQNATKVVVLATTDGYVVLSASSDDKTAELFRQLLPLVQSAGV